VTEIRLEKPEDILAIRAVQEQAFRSVNEARLVDLLRKANQALISLVAIRDEQVVGHVLFSPITLTPAARGLQGVGLAPVGVLPQFQKLGIGSNLVRKGLEDCKQAGHDFVVVLGAPEYYGRFGFSRASSFGLQNEYGVDDEFMAMELKGGVLSAVNALVKYSPLFNESGC
jgi:putative acetyltransferase